MLLQNRQCALVTGSSRGIGRGIALKLAEHGVKNIAINYLKNDGAAKETVVELKKLGAEGILVPADVSRPDDIAKMFSTVKEKFGSLDIFVSNARSDLSAFYATPLEVPLEKFQHAFDSQVRAFHLASLEAARLMPQTGGRIIAISFTPGCRTGSWQPWAAMGSAKAAMESLCRYFAVALAKRGITANIVSPGATDDSVLSGLPPAVFGLIKEWHESGWTPMGRLGVPADIGNAVVMLCSDLASFITGQTLHVDGGSSIMDPTFPLAIQKG